jgi:prepilin-type N-terminal cleavage/methylation domain-containing protein
MKKRLRGYSLIEISIVLGVIGILTSGFLPFWMSVKKTSSHHVNHQKMEQLLKVLGSFLTLHKYLPCPSHDKDDGIAPKVCSSSFGYIPYKTLNVPKNMAQTVSGEWITYGVDPAFTTPFKSLVDPDRMFPDMGVYCRKKNFEPILKIDESDLSLKQFDPIVMFLMVGKPHRNGFFIQLSQQSEVLTRYYTRSHFLSLYSIGPCRP